MTAAASVPHINQQAAVDESNPLLRKIGYFLGPLIFLSTFLLDAPTGMNDQAWHVCGLALWMASWWITEAMPLPVASLLSVIFLPTIIGLPFRDAVASFANPIIFLFLGGFIISQGMEKHKLHLRIGLGLLKIVGTGGRSILAGMMFATAFMGMWMSNTATVIMMLPMAVSIAYLLTHHEGQEDIPHEQNHFAKAMALGVAYAGVLGGLATFVSTPTNALLYGFIQKTYGRDLDLAQWMSFGVPLTLILLALTWWLLNRLFIRHATLRHDVNNIVCEEYAKLGPMRYEEKAVAVVFGTVALCWIFSDVLQGILGGWLSGVMPPEVTFNLPDAVIGIAGAMALFLIPTSRKMDDFVLHWRDTKNVPWGILVFFGGSLCISDALTTTGVSEWLSGELNALEGVSLLILISVVVGMIILASEMLSNVATVTAFLPILAALATSLNVDPMMILVPATLAASTAFMLPGASAPNALAFSTGYLKVKDMIKTGLLLNIISAIIIVIFSLTVISGALSDLSNASPGAAETVAP